MPNAKKSTNTDQFLVNVYDAARSQGFESKQCIAMLKTAKLNWNNKEVIEPIAAEFRLGHIAGYLSLTSRDAAVSVMKTPASARTTEEQHAYRAAVSAWSNVKLVAGAPNAVTGGKRKGRAAGGKAKGQQAPANSNVRSEARANTTAMLAAVKTPQALAPIVSKVFPKIAAPEDVGHFAVWLCDTIEAFEKRNPHVKMGEYRTVFHTFIGDIRALQRQHRAA